MASLLRAGCLALPIFAAGIAFVAACGDDEEPPIKARAIDAGAALDGSTGGDASASDGGAPGDAAADADAGFDAGPPLCSFYPDTKIADAGDGEPAAYELRWFQIALRTFFLGTVDGGAGEDPQNVANSCEIGKIYDENNAPFALDCLGQQLRAIAGCVAPSNQPYNYEQNGADFNDVNCTNPDLTVTPGAKPIHLGFFDPATQRYTNKDFDVMLALVRNAAISTGMPAGDADRLVALLNAKRGTVVVSADAGDDYSHKNPDNCPVP